MNDVIISVGSNIDAASNIQAMLEILGSEVIIIGVSRMVRTTPIGIINQPQFTNGAVRIITDLNKEELKILLKNIEDRLGRDRTLPKFGPRTIDLDIVMWNGDVVDSDYYTRDFVKNAVDELS